VEGILHGHRFEIMDLDCHVSSTKISVYQIYWRNKADCIALSVWIIAEYHLDGRIISPNVLKIGKCNSVMLVINYITGYKCAVGFARTKSP
jgi:hypothetical protein